MNDFDLLLNVCSSSLSYCLSNPATKNIEVLPPPQNISSPRTTKTVVSPGSIRTDPTIAQMQVR